MEEDANSWIRRTKFSHTICHRLDPARLASYQFSIEQNQNSILKSRPKSESNRIPIQRNPTTNKHRAVSPKFETRLSDTFKEARSDRKRFSTPHPQRKEPEKRVVSSSSHRDSHANRTSGSSTHYKHFSSMKFYGTMKSRKEPPWAKYFDDGGGKITAIEMADEWMVDLSQLFLGLRFAHGANSQLYHGMYKEEAVAVKIIRLPSLPDDEDNGGDLASRLERQFSREVRLLSRLHHQNIVKFIATCRKPPVFCIITEYLSEGSLRGYLHKIEPDILSLPKVIMMALDIAKGMEFIHSQGVIHRDLKPENILINENFQLKIADFGIACEEAYCDSLADDPGTYRWMAPEMIKRKQYGRKVDVYGFGLMLWEMVAGTIPYEDMTPIQAAFAVVNKNLRPAIPVNCPPALRALIEQCWSLHPDKRPEFWQVVKVLEQFESSLECEGTLNLVPNLTWQHDHKKGLIHWIQKLGPIRAHHNTLPLSSPKPKFS